MTRIDYESWEDRKFSVSRLKLDPENPRLNEIVSIPSPKRIIAYMFEKEEIMPLVRAIAIKGYFVNEMPIVFMEGSTATVLEGNRRVTACKVLLDPSLAPVNHRKAVTYYASLFNTASLKKLRCVIAPSREAAKVVIQNRHTGELQIEKWDGIQQDLWYIRDIKRGFTVDELATVYAIPKSEVLTSLFRYKIFAEAKEIPTLSDSTYRYLNTNNGGDKFPISTLWRLVSNNAMANFLGLRFSSTGEIDYLLPKEEFNKRYKNILEGLESGDINSRTMNRSDDIRDHVKKLSESGLFDMSIELEEPVRGAINPEALEGTAEPQAQSPSSSTDTNDSVEGSDAGEDSAEMSGNNDELGQPSNAPSRSRRKGGTAARMIGVGYACDTKAIRINKIFEELQTLPLKYTNAVSILFRTLMELVLLKYTTEQNILDSLRDEQIKDYVTKNAKIVDRLKNYLKQAHQIDVDEEALKRVLNLRAEVEDRWSPTLGFMLGYYGKYPEKLLSNINMQESFQRYVTGQLSVTHRDFNGFVHNAFYPPLDIEVLAEFGNFFSPLLEDIISRLESPNDDNSEEE